MSTSSAFARLRASLPVVALLSGALAFQGAQAYEAKAKAPADIVDTAVAAGSFKTLTAAVKAAGLQATLTEKGPFTVFAPTDEAFAKLPAGHRREAAGQPRASERRLLLTTWWRARFALPMS